MVVRIRLARFGCRNRPFYRVMAADSRSPRDGKHLEVLGYYNPLPGEIPPPRFPTRSVHVAPWRPLIYSQESAPLSCATLVVPAKDLGVRGSFSDS
jgi:ribosomal protein S16